MDAPDALRGLRILVVTASDARFFPFLEGMLRSLQPSLNSARVQLACFDMGLTDGQRAGLAARGAAFASPQGHFGIDPALHRPALLSFLARPFLPSYFPGHDIYVWIDSDVWFQEQPTFWDYVAGAAQHGMAVTHERERAYRFQPQLFGWTSKHFALGYGLAEGAYLLTRPHLNAGFFAAHRDAPHWEAWARRYEVAIARTGRLVPHDQFALNQALHGELRARSRMPLACLDPTHNWIVDRGVPMWNDELDGFCTPYAPYQRIGALHLAGPAKRRAYRIRRTGGGSFLSCVLRGARPGAPAAVPSLPDAAALSPAPA